MAAASPLSAQPSSELRQLIQKVAGGAALSKDEIRGALEQMTGGQPRRRRWARS